MKRLFQCGNNAYQLSLKNDPQSLNSKAFLVHYYDIKHLTTQLLLIWLNLHTEHAQLAKKHTTQAQGTNKAILES